MIIKKITKIGAIVCALLYIGSVLLDTFGMYSLDPAIQGYLLAAEMVCLGIYLLMTLKQILFGVICLIAAAVVLFMAIRLQLI